MEREEDGSGEKSSNEGKNWSRLRGILQSEPIYDSPRSDEGTTD